MTTHRLTVAIAAVVRHLRAYDEQSVPGAARPDNAPLLTAYRHMIAALHGDRRSARAVLEARAIASGGLFPAGQWADAWAKPTN